MERGPRAGDCGVFTVDVEDWYHPLVKDPAAWPAYEDRVVPPTLRLLELLEATGSRATFFVLGVIAERHPELVRRIVDGGHEVGCHGHHHQSLAWIGPDAFRADLDRALAALAAGGATEVISYRAPYFSLGRATAWALDILAERGFRIDGSIFPLRTGYYGQSGASNRPHRIGPLLEFPMVLPTLAGVRVPLTGGFYARFFPASWIRAGVRRVLEAGAEPLFFVHPWELDVGQPRVAVGRFLTWRHYLRLDRTEAVLRGLLDTWRWLPLRESAAARAALATTGATGAVWP